MAVITEVWVPGHPKTKGSLDFKGHGHVEESVKGSKEWRELVARTVRADLTSRWLDSNQNAALVEHANRIVPEPTRLLVLVQLGFWLDHPDPCGPTVRAGDVDKLIRNVLDALTDAGAYVDDNQVCQVAAVKLASGGRAGESGVLIRVTEFEPEQLSKVSVLWSMARKILRGH